MGKKMSLIPFLFKPTHPPSSSPSSNNSTWPWAAACGSPKTLSFRADKIMNSVYITDSRFSDPSDSDLAGSIGVVELVEEDDDDSGGPESIENVIRGLKSDRLFFEAGESSSCMLATNNKAKSNGPHEYVPAEEGNVEDDDNGEGNTRVMEMESSDPFADFKKSMEEMVDAHGLKDNWEGLQELLCLYLKVNGKSNHGYVVGAFVDLLVALHFISSTTSSCSSIASSSCCGGGGGGGGDDGVGDIDSCSTTAVTDQSPVSGLSFSSNYSSTSNSTTTPYYSLSSLEEESAAPANGDDDDEDNDLVDKVVLT